MRYRRETPLGDMMFGAGDADFHIDTPDGVAQAVKTRLGLQLGQWFADDREGIDYRTRVLGKYTMDTRDSTIRERVLGTFGVTAIIDYAGSLNPDTRGYSVEMTIDTLYGQAVLQTVI